MRFLLLSLAFLCGCAHLPEGGRAVLPPAEISVEDNWLMAMRYHLRGEWEESNAHLEENLRRIEKTPRLLLGHELGAALFADSLRGYSGDFHELVAAHNFSMINFAMMGEADEALVEAKRADQLMNFAAQHGQPHAEDPFCRYLSAKLYEAEGLVDDAYIDLAKAHDAFVALSPSSGVGVPAFLGSDLISVAQRAGRGEEARRWQAAFPQAAQRPKGSGEIWVLVYHGRVPSLEPAAFGTARQAQRVSPPWELGLLRAGGQAAVLEPVYDFSKMAAQALSRRNVGAGIRGVGRTTLRVAFAAAVTLLAVAANTTPDEKFYAWVFNDQSGDLRAWRNLPERVYAARLWLPPGKYDLELEASLAGASEKLVQRVRARKNRIGIVRFVTAGSEESAPAASPSAREN